MAAPPYSHHPHNGMDDEACDFVTLLQREGLVRVLDETCEAT
jgi:hypothetical protein